LHTPRKLAVMSWITKAEKLLNSIDQSAASVLQQKPDESPLIAPQINIQQSIPRVASTNRMILKTPKKTLKTELDEKWESTSESLSRRSSFSSKHAETVIDKSEPALPLTSSNASLNSFSVERELATAKIMMSELRSENEELKQELESLNQAASSQAKVTEFEEQLCASLLQEKDELLKT